MKLRLFAALFLFGLVLVASVWTYKGNELKDNQILVFVTGSDVSPTEAPSGIPTIETRAPTQVHVDGHSIPCKVTHFESDSKAMGEYGSVSTTRGVGSLENGVQVPADNLYLKVAATDHDWATTEAINSLEIAGCAVSYTTGGTKLRINALSAQDGGLVYPPHLTHQNGLDADLAFTCNTPSGGYVDCNNQDSSVGTFDPETNWIFVRTLAEYTPVRQILLDRTLINQLRVYATENDPGPLTDQIFSTLLLHWKGHGNHFHVTFHCSPSDKPKCIEYPGGFRGEAASGPAIEEIDTGEEEAGTADVTAKSDTELLTLARTRTPTCLQFTDAELNPVISECSSEYGINEKLLKAQIIAESGGNCGDNGGDTLAQSGANALGLLQLRKTAVAEVNNYRDQDNQINFDDLINPSINVCAGAQYMAILWQRRAASNIETTEDLLAAYNMGPTAFGRGDTKPQETIGYVAKIKTKYREKFGSEMPTEPTISNVAVSARGNSVAPRSGVT